MHIIKFRNDLRRHKAKCEYISRAVITPQSPRRVERIQLLRLLLNIFLCLIIVGCTGNDSGSEVVIASSEGGNESLRLAWDPPTDQNGNPQPQVVGYALYFGPTSGVYVESIDVGFYTTLTLLDLQPNRPYYFVVTAYDRWENESDFSNEVCTIVSPTGVEPCEG
jgi:hypothetical protein